MHCLTNCYDAIKSMHKNDNKLQLLDTPENFLQSECKSITKQISLNLDFELFHLQSNENLTDLN